MIKRARSSLSLAACCWLALGTAVALAQPAHHGARERGDATTEEGRRTRAVQSATPRWIEPVEIPTKAPAASNGREVLLLEQQSRVETGQIQRYFHGASRPTALPGLSLSSTIGLELDASYQTYAFHFIRIRRDGQVIDAMKDTDFRITDAEDDRAERLVLGMTNVTAYVRDVRLGDVVEYAYSINGAQPALHGKFAGAVWLDRGMPVGRLRHRLLWPSDRPLHIQPFGAADNPTVAQQGAFVSYTWQLDDVPPSLDEDNVPAWFDATPWVQLSEFTSWQEVADWAVPLYANVCKPTAAVRERAAQWIKEDGERGAIEHAIRFVQDEVHYLGFELGVGSLLPRAPDLVIARRFGDCKDKAVLLVSLLTALGVEATPALVHSDDLEHVRDRLPSPYAFDHVIVKATIDGQPRWIDTTASFERGPLAERPNADYGAGLLIARGTKALESIPRSDLTEPLTMVRETFVVQPDASVRLEVLTRYRYEKARSMRYTLATQPLGDLQREYTSFYRRMYGELSVASPITVTDSDASDALEVRESYLLKGLWDDGAELYAWLIDDRLPDTDEPERYAPLSLEPPLYLRHEIEVELPAGFDSYAEDENIEGPHFKYTYGAKYEPKKLLLHYELRTRAEAVLASDLNAYQELRKRTEPTQTYRILRTGKAPQYRVITPEREHDNTLGWIMIGGFGGLALWGLVWSLGAARRNVRESRRKHRFFSRFKSAGGETAESALRVHTRQDLAQHMTRLRCTCADKPLMAKAREPTRVQYMGELLWTQAAVCERCHRRVTRYFRVAIEPDAPETE